MAGLFLLSGLFGVVALIVPVALVIGLVVVFALRGEEDEGSGRAAALYLSMASFVGFLALLAAVTGLAAGITDLVADNPEGGWASYDVSTDSASSFDSSSSFGSSSSIMPAPDPVLPHRSGQGNDDRDWTTIIQALIAGAASLLVLRFHWPRLEAVGTRAVPGSAAARLRQSYCYVVCFLVVVTMLVAASVATFNVVQAIAPGTTGAANRGDAVESFVPLAVLAAGAAVLFRLHWKRVTLPPFLQPVVEPTP